MQEIINLIISLNIPFITEGVARFIALLVLAGKRSPLVKLYSPAKI